MSCVQLSEGGFQVVYPLGLLSRCPDSELSKFYMDMANKVHNLHTYIHKTTTTNGSVPASIQDPH